MLNESKRILVTGASKGIGRAIAIALAHAGYQVVCHYHRDLEGVKQTMAAIQAAADANQQPQQPAHCLQFDISNRAETYARLEEEVATRGAFWGVVLNAGIKKDSSFLAMEAEDWSSVIETNLSSFYNLLSPLVRPMLQLKSGGRILCISSLSGSLGVGGQVNYSASKGGLEAAARSLAMEVAKRQVTVNCVCPGFVETDMLKDMNKDELADQVPMKRIGKAEEVAELVKFLMSDAAAYITKQSIRIDGGIS
jgi:3-oxoacyl-[acyl-carrier protein] reductase